MTADEALQAYWAESSAWDADRTTTALRSARHAWWVAGAGWVCAVAATAALAMLTPLKRVEPFLVRVDRSTGIVDVVPVYAGQGAFAEPVTRYFLSHYVSICERFDYATAESDYEECGAFNSPKLNAAWFELWNTANAASPLNVHKDGSIVRAEVTSVTFFHRASGLTDLAQVRYLKALRTADGSSEQVTHWIATLEYAYGKPSQDPKVRRWNPLGFRILDFHTEPEIVNEAQASSSTKAEADRTARSARAGVLP